MSNLTIHSEIDRRMLLKPPTPLTEERLALMDAARTKFISLAHWVADNVPPGRELQMCLTNIELAQRDAIAALHHGGPTS